MGVEVTRKPKNRPVHVMSGAAGRPSGGAAAAMRPPWSTTAAIPLGLAAAARSQFEAQPNYLYAIARGLHGDGCTCSVKNNPGDWLLGYEKKLALVDDNPQSIVRRFGGPLLG